MNELHPRILEKNGKKEFVILSYEEYTEVTTALSDYEDLQELRAVKSAELDSPTKSLAEVREDLGI